MAKAKKVLREQDSDFEKSEGKTGFSALMFRMTEEDAGEGVEMDERPDEERGSREDNFPGHSMAAGKRSNSWYDKIEQQVEENRKKTRSNENYLVRLDYRTVWIIRLLVAVLGTVVGGIIINLL